MDKEELESLEGTVVGFKFQNDDSGFCIFQLKSKTGQHTVTGTLPGISVGEALDLKGEWFTHATYGKQFKVSYFQHKLPEEGSEILKYLTAGTIEGMTTEIAKKLVKEFGDQVFHVIEHEHEKLTEIKSISKKRATKIYESFCKQLSSRQLITFLSTHGLSVQLAAPLMKFYGEHALKVLESDPYILTGEDFGVKFKQVDALAMELGKEAEAPSRLESGILYSLQMAENEGHSCLPKEELLRESSALLGCKSAQIVPIFEELLSNGNLYEGTIKGEIFYYLPELQEAESNVAYRMMEMSQQELLPPNDLDKLIERIQSEQKIEYSEEQAEAVALAAKSQVMLLTGGPGTGKTTSMKGVLALFQALDLETSLVAPTGRAAQRLGELCSEEASTIHRLLDAGIDPNTGKLVFMRDEDDLLNTKAVIVDETSMVDIRLMSSLIKALPNDCRLVLVGDPDQLPSVGAGNLFADLIESDAIPKVRLSQIFRQAEESLIVQNAHRVNQGISPDIVQTKGDFFFLPRPNDTQTVEETIVELCSSRIPNKLGFTSDQIQVLSPTRKWSAGTAALNKALQASLNPPSNKKGERTYGDWVFRVGDRVMQVKNNYDITWTEFGGTGSGQGVFNGDIGAVEGVSQSMVTVNFEGRLVEYTTDMLPQLEPAFAITVHKAQGSEYPVVVFAVSDIAPILRTRSILYTGITRAKQLFIAVGCPVLLNDIVNRTGVKRFSGLKYRLLGELLEYDG